MRWKRGQCFDSTYEGLKRPGDQGGGPQPAGFDSTYEGLKLLPPVYSEILVPRFDSTYEGLKLKLHFVPLKPRGLVSTVPMRA